MRHRSAVHAHGFALALAWFGCDSPTSSRVAMTAPLASVVPPMPAPTANPSSPSRRCATQGRNAAGIPWKPTGALALSPAVRDLVQQIEVSCHWQSYRFQMLKPTKRTEWMKALSSAWSEAEAIELLRHESPIIRGYTSYELVRQFPSSAPMLRPIFSDESPVLWFPTDEGQTSPLSQMLAANLCGLASPSADKELLWALQNAPETFQRNSTFECLRERIPEEAASAAFRFLQDRGNIEAIHALGFDPRPEYLPVVQRFAQGSAVKERLAAVMTLAAFNEDAALQTAQSLTTDPDPEVRVAARISAWRLGQASPSEVDKLLTPTRGLERVAAEALIWFPSERSLAAVERYLIAHRDDDRLMHVLIAQRPTQALLKKMRRWAMRIWLYSDEYNQALYYLMEAKDAASAPLFDDALRFRRYPTSIIGAQGLAQIGPAGKPYIRDVEKLLDDNNGYLIVAAANALLTLKSRQSLPRLREAKARIPKEGWVPQRIDEVISELEGLP